MTERVKTAGYEYKGKKAAVISHKIQCKFVSNYSAESFEENAISPIGHHGKKYKLFEK